jgi:hypothetical protein
MAGAGIRQFSSVPVATQARFWIGGFVTVLMTAAAVAVLAFALPLFWLGGDVRYSVAPGELRIDMREGWIRRTKVVALDSIREALPVTLGRGYRTMGTGMPGYCAGLFRYDALGTVWQATTCCADAVLLRVEGEERPVVVAPADREHFLAALRDGSAGRFDPWPGPPRPAGFELLGLLLLVPILLLPVGPSIFFLSPERIRYEVGRGTLSMKSAFATRRLELAGAKASRLAPRRVLRLYGSGLPGYYTGTFAIDGHRAHVSATTVAKGVLVEGRERAFVTPADVRDFLEALRAEGVAVDGD